ncbi:MAG: redoxin domain-containing protein [Holophagales bacterium]|nr:MAG: redoxin domain-containing protein [Holophagales bacterium]
MPLNIGEEALNFDLTSSEDVLIMLRDEVARTPVVLYVFRDAADPGVIDDLVALGAAVGELGRRRAKVLAVAKQPLAGLKQLQVERKLLFPLLHDDRDFCTAYGVPAPEEGSTSRPALLLVGRDQRVRWQAGAGVRAAAVLPELFKQLEAENPPSATYPRRVINRFIGRGVRRAG